MTELNGTDPEMNEDDALAAEYVLGVLQARERESCANRIASDPAFAALVSDWETRMSGLNDDFDEVSPPPSVKQKLDARLFPEPSGVSNTSFWQNLAVWRAMFAVTAAAVLVLAVVVLRGGYLEPVIPETMVASLSAEDSDLQFVAVVDQNTNAIRVVVVAGEKPSNGDLELWVIEGGNAPKSLGLVSAAGSLAPTVHSISGAVPDGATLAVSLEPVGGSTTGAPTGPVLAAGVIKKI
jgi:anti-sigma-K factor RskA